MKEFNTTIKERTSRMGRTIRARFSRGVIEPLEKVDIAEGKEITVTIMHLPIPAEKVDALKATAGGWKGLIDADELKKNIYTGRLISTLPPPAGTTI